MDEEKEKIRKTISSILLSTPLTLTIGQLTKDYRDVIGSNIPFQKFGYKSIDQFLHSMSAFEIYGQGNGAQIKAKVTSKAAHIDKLVVQQKFNIAKTRKKISRPPARRHQSTPLPVNQCNFLPNYSSQNSQHQNKVSPLDQESANLPSTSSKQQYHSLSPPKTTKQNLYKKQYHQNTPLPNSSSTSPTRGINLPPYLETSQPKSKFGPDKATFVSSQIKKRYNRTLPNKSRSQDYAEMESQCQSIASGNSNLRELPSTWPSPSDDDCLENYFSSLSDDIKTTAKGAAVHLSSTSTSFDDVFVSDSEDEDYVNYKVPAEVQKNLCILIKNYQNGLWCNELPNAYKTRFRKTLDHMDYGYKTLMALCMDLDRIFHCIRPDRGDIKLYDKSKPLPLNAANSLHFSDLLKNTEIVDYPKDNALPDVSDVIMYRKQNEIPSDVVHLFEELPRQWISQDIKPMSFIDVDVGEIYDPSKFWIILRGAETSQKLDAMMDEMQDFYSVHKELQIPKKKLEVGLYCAAVILEEYHRGIIVHLMPHVEDQIKVFFIDYGTVSPIFEKDVCYLHRKFFVLPQQAIRARLANIYPPTEKMQWSRQSASAFLEMVFQKSMVAQVYKIDEKRKALELFIADTTGDEDYYVNDRLVELGHAIFTYQEQIPFEPPPTEEPNVRFIHLFPSFDELEQGLVPTASQMERMLETGVELHHIYSWYYRKSSDLEDFAEWPTNIPEKHESTTNISHYMKLADEKNGAEDLMDFSSNQQFFSNNSEPLVDLMSSYNCGINSYENTVNNTSSYDFPVLNPEVLSTNAENNYSTNSSFSKRNTEVSGLSNFDIKSNNKELPHLDSNLDEIKKQTKEFENNFASGKSRLESQGDNLSFATSFKAQEDNSVIRQPSYKLTASCSSLQKNDKKGDVELIDLSSSNYLLGDNNFEVSSSADSSERLKSPEYPGESLKTKTPSLKLDKSKIKKKSAKKIKSNVSPTNTTEYTRNQSSITFPKTIRPPPGFERTLNVTSNNTQNVIPSVQQNFFNISLGNTQSAMFPAVPTFNPYNLGPMGIAPNVLQQQLLLQEMLKNQMLIENFQRQQQTIIQQEQNKNIVTEQVALLQQMTSQLYLDGNKDNCNVITAHKKMVIKIDFFKKKLHLIRFANQIYCSVQEVQKVFFGDKWPIIKLKRHIAVTDPSIRIGNFHKDECIELSQELLQAGVVTEEELFASMCLLHLVTFKDLPKLINAVSHSKLDFQNFDKYLLEYDHNSKAWL